MDTPMVSARVWTVVAMLSFLLVPGCVISSWSFDVPTVVRAGSILEVSVSVTATSAGATPGGYIGAVIQVPNEFQYLSHEFSGGQGSSFTTQVQPPQMAVYAAEPGSYLIGMTGSNVGSGSATFGSARIHFRAPATNGTYAFKIVILADSGDIPSGITQFAAITSPTHVHTTTVTTGHPY